VVDASFVCVPPQVKTRTLTQIRTHAQKYFKKQQEDREREILKEQAAASGLGGGNDVSPPTPTLHLGCLSYAAPTAGTYDPLTPPRSFPGAVSIQSTQADSGEAPQKNLGRWTFEEQAAFVRGLSEHDSDWKAISLLVKTRSLTQIRTHAQKFFKRRSQEASVRVSCPTHDTSSALLQALLLLRVCVRARLRACRNKRVRGVAFGCLACWGRGGCLPLLREPSARL
jgi:SHAQKYF class myb-like DNA-binding protein